jgi:glycosyltransferase involved in cell wall biosynthesis
MAVYLEEERQTIPDGANQEFLSAVIPISGMSEFSSEISSWVIESVQLGVQVVLVHDLSEESSGDFLRELALNFPNHVTYCEGAFGNPGAARNRGLKEARGKWICFWDADDRPYPSNYLRMVKIADQENYNFAVGQYQELDFYTKKINHKPLGSTNSLLVSYRLARRLGIWRFAFKRSQIKELVFPDCEIGEDQVFILLCDISAKRTLIYRKDIYQYTRNFPQQLTGKNNRYETLQNLFSNYLTSAATQITRPNLLNGLIVFQIWMSLARNGRWRNQYINLTLLLKIQLKILRSRRTEHWKIIS